MTKTFTISEVRVQLRDGPADRRRHSESPLAQGDSTVPAYEKLTVLLVTLALLVALRLLDQHYRLFQQAASIRARILEKRLNADLTSDISEFYKLGRWWKAVQWLYNGFLLLTFLLGFAILFPYIVEIALLGSGTLVSYYFIRSINARTLDSVEDWSVDRKIVEQGDPVRLTWTNLVRGSEGRGPEKNELSWEVTTQSGSSVTAGAPASVSLKHLESYEWLWDTNGLDPGLYRLSTKSQKTVGSLMIQVVKAKGNDGSG